MGQQWFDPWPEHTESARTSTCPASAYPLRPKGARRSAQKGRPAIARI